MNRSPMVERCCDMRDQMTHVERINPGQNPAWIPGAEPVAEQHAHPRAPNVLMIVMQPVTPAPEEIVEEVILIEDE